MLFSDTAFQLFEPLERQQDTTSLLAAFQRLVSAFGMAAFCIGDPSRPEIVRENRVWGTTWPSGWFNRYAQRNYQSVDPLVRGMNHGAAPFRWSGTYGAAAPAGRRVLDEAAVEFHMRDGLAIPLHDTGGLAAGITIAARHYDLGKRDEVELHLAALYFHAKFVALRAAVAPAPAPRLTPRERECLNWVASGKTDWEISQILSISEQTAHGYVQNALSKLGASTRAQAVAIAVRSRQILQ